jgi:hypothetical protein
VRRHGFQPRTDKLKECPEEFKDRTIYLKSCLSDAEGKVVGNLLAYYNEKAKSESKFSNQIPFVLLSLAQA